MTYTSASKSAGIGTTYASAFKSAGTGSKNAGIGSESAGTYPHIQKPTVWSAGKKNAEIGILTLSQRFLGLSQQFWKHWDSPIFL